MCIRDSKITSCIFTGTFHDPGQGLTYVVAVSPEQKTCLLYTSCTSCQIRLELLLSGHELYVRADMEQIQQVLYNLLDNAIKFSNDNSSVQIETTVKGGKVFVSVKDYGTGIPKELSLIHISLCLSDQIPRYLLLYCH